MRVAGRAGNLSHQEVKGVETDFDHPRWGGKPLNVVLVGGIQLVGSGLLMGLVYKMGHAKLMGYGALAGSVVGVGLGCLELHEESAKKNLVERQINSDAVATWRGTGKTAAWKTAEVGLTALFTAVLVGGWKQGGSVIVPFLTSVGAVSLITGSALVAVRPKRTVEKYATETERESGRFSYLLRLIANFGQRFDTEDS